MSMIEVPLWLFIVICVMAVFELLWVVLLIIDGVMNIIDGNKWWRRKK